MAYGTINADLMTTSDGVSSSGLYGFKNRIINGAMVIDQRNAGASVTNIYGGVYPVDRFSAYGSVANKYTIQQTPSTTETGYATRIGAGFTNYILATSSGVTTFGATDEYEIFYKVEGNNVADLAWGTSNAKTVTLSFWVRSSLTGTFGGTLSNASYNRSYVFSFTINSANTWEQKTITVAGEQSGTWGTGTGIGIYLSFDLGSGTSLRTTAGSWVTGYYTSVTSAVSVLGTSGATYAITGVQLEKGSTATSFDYRPYGTELQLCQRYLPTLTASASGTVSTIGAGLSTTSARVVIPFTVTPRVSPTGVTVISVTNFGLTSTGSGGVAASAIAFDSASFTGASVTVTVSSGMTANGAHVMYQSSPAQLQFTGCEL